MDGEAGIGLQELVRGAVRAEMGGLVDELRRFLDRRIRELSTEIHATFEMVDVSETHLSDQLQQMHGALARVLALPAAATRNSGLELEGIVQANEEAANRIIGAAETIRDVIGKRGSRAVTRAQVNAIFEACVFHDLTGQRVRRALEQLQIVEGMLAQLVEKTGAQPVERVRPDTVRAATELTGASVEMAQDEIDKLFA